MEKQVIEIVRNAGKILKSAHCGSSDIEVKPGEANFVTKFDISIQEFLKKELLGLYPDAEFIGEEGYDGNEMRADISIIADPIDGTTNFIKDYRHSCISVAIMKNKQPYIAVVYNPYLDDLFYAKNGYGSYLNGEKISVSNEGLKNGLIIFGTSPYYPDLTDLTFDTAKKLFKSAADIRRTGSAALDMCYVACGRAELFFEYLISPWDFAASSLIVKEAGGIVTTCCNKPINYNLRSSVVAAGLNAHKKFIKLINNDTI